MSAPLVSILIITYNQQDLVEETLLSALEQDYDNLQIIVSDDHSPDATQKIIRSIADKHPKRLVPILNQSRAGITGNTNRALSEAKGELIAFQGGDDLLCPGKITKQVDFMQAHPEVVLSYHDVDVFDSVTGNSLYHWSERYGRMNGDIKSVIRYGTYMCGTSVMVYKKCIPSGGFDERIRFASDWLLWVHVLAQCDGKVGYIDNVLARYRRHIKNITRNWDWKFEDQNLTLALIESQFPEYVNLVRQRRSELYFLNAVWQFKNGNKGSAWKLGWNATFLSPPSIPWLRLVWRETLFYLRRKGKQDDLLKSFLS